MFLWLVFTVNCWCVHAGCDLITDSNTFPRMQHNIGSVPSLRCSPTPVPRSLPNHVSHTCVRLGQPQVCIQTHSIMLGVHRRITMHNLLWGPVKEIYLPYKPCCGWSHFLTGRDLSRWSFFWVSHPSSNLTGASIVCDGFVGQTLEPLLTHSKLLTGNKRRQFCASWFFFLPWVVKVKWCCKASDDFPWERQLSSEWGEWRQQSVCFFVFSPHLPPLHLLSFTVMYDLTTNTDTKIHYTSLHIGGDIYSVSLHQLLKVKILNLKF